MIKLTKSRGDDKTKIINACAAAVDELAKTRLLIEALERENKLINERLQTEKKAAAILHELYSARSGEAEALRAALAAKNETIAAKDAVIAGQDKLVQALKNKKTSPWKRIGDVLLGEAVLAVLK
ncbi:hypothetical protein BH18ACI3_BH18ACI3_07120 [soil metagenome]